MLQGPLIPSSYWPRMNDAVQGHLYPCQIFEINHILTKEHRAALNRLPRFSGWDILAIDVFGGKASPPKSEGGNIYVLIMDDLLNRFGIAAPMAEQTAQT